jgi:hypothetical protein
MELLRESALLERDYSVSLDSGSWIRGVRGGSFAWLFDWLFSERDNKKRELIVAEYPESLICPHCEYIIERK